MTKVTTAVLPVAGMGTRFLPVTKASPKEMLPIIDKPLIQYVVDEAVAAGITQIVLVTSYTKRAIEDYFDSNFELETRLEQRGKYTHLSKITRLIPESVSLVYVRQKAPRGLGDAILCAKNVVGNNPFAVLLADDIVDSVEPCLVGMLDRFQKTQSSVLAVERVPREATDQYGIVSVNGKENRICSIVEKPVPEKAPSTLGVIGRYVLTPDVFSFLESIEPGIGGELQLTDAIAQLLIKENVTAFEFNGRRFDCGSKQGFLQATLAYAMKRPELRDTISEFVEGYMSTK